MYSIILQYCSIHLNHNKTMSWINYFVRYIFTYAYKNEHLYTNELYKLNILFFGKLSHIEFQKTQDYDYLQYLM